jgi:hypothetical protein
MAQQTQTYKTHRQYVPAVHFFVVPILLLNVIVEGLRLYKYQTPYHAWVVLVAIALAVFAFAARRMSLRAQDRVIRLEERLRLMALMPADQHARISELTPDQIVALRFASDEEAPDLARRTLNGELRTQGEIKKAIKNWRGDYHRV